MYVGTYLWGVLVLDESGDEHDQLVLDPGKTVRFVAFGTCADGALARLPLAIRAPLPDHGALEEANERYPVHSLPVMPSGWDHVRGPMEAG